VRLLGGAVGLAEDREVIALLFAAQIITIDGATPTKQWKDEQEAFVRRAAEEHKNLAPRLPVVIHLDEDYVAAARARRSIEVVDDCGDALCGVASDDFPDDWRIAELRALFTPATGDPIERNAFATALLGHDVDQLAGALIHAGVLPPLQQLTHTDPLIAIPALASLMRFIDPKHVMRFDAMHEKLQSVDEQPWRAGLKPGLRRTGFSPSSSIHGATFSITNRVDRSAIANGAYDELKRLRAIGYDTISLLPFAGQRGAQSTALRRFAGSPASETDLAMRLAALRAHRLGMRVMLKPHIWNAPSGDATTIDPGAAGWPKWFASYEDVIVHNALLARLIDAEWLVIGTELSHSESRPEWRDIILRVRALYGGRVTYAANFDTFESTPLWNELDAIGIDAYFPLSPKRDATDAELRAGASAAVARIDATAKKFRKRVILTELGYPATESPWIEPWREERGGEPHPAAQARAFAAMLDAVKHSSSIDGFFIWKYESDPTRTDLGGYLPKGKEAEKVIARALAASDLQP
jgi:hypothetical protein